MSNIYKKGARKEYKIVCDLRKSGNWDIIQRTAGSHSPIDIIAIDKKDKRILLIQSKRTLNKSMDYINPKLKNKLIKENNDLIGKFNVYFVVK